MKLLELELRAFGPFRDARLDFRAGEQGLHVVYGPNEAGKSSTLRALHALLYGVPERTQDTFLHESKALRVGGVLRGADGRELTVFRRKGRKNTLLDAADAPLDENALAPLLGQVDADAFARLFGIDHHGLVSGGEQLLADRGRESAALFSSGLGGVNVNAVLDRLEQEAGELFKPGGSKPAINAELRRLDELEKELKRSALSSREWDEARKAVQRARKAVEQIDGQLQQAGARLRVLARIRANMPLFARLENARARLGELGEVVLLPEDFGARHRDAAERRRSAQQALAREGELCERLQQQVAARQVSEELLGAEQLLESLREQLGAMRKAAQDRPELVAEQRAFAERAQRLCGMLEPGASREQFEARRPLLAARRQIEAQAREFELAQAGVRRASRAASAASDALAQERGAREALPALPATERLQAAVTEARRLGDIDGDIAAQRRRIEQHDAAVARELGALGLWDGGIDALCSAPLPAAETLERFAADYLELGSRELRAREQFAQVEAQLGQAAQAQRELELAGAVPLESDLDAARAARGAGWSLLRRQWLAQEDVRAEAEAWAPGAGLPDAFERAMERADEIADRLRREAGRVQQLAAAVATRAARSAELEALHEQRAALGRERARLDAAWQEAWRAAGVRAGAVAEMKSWRERAAQLCARARARDELAARLLELEDARERQRALLDGEIAALAARAEGGAGGAALAPVLLHAEALLGHQQQEATRHAALAISLRGLEKQQLEAARELREAEEEQGRARDAWQALIERAAPGWTRSPGELMEYVEQLATLLGEHDAAAALGARIRDIDADAARFAAEVTALVTRLEPGLAGRPSEEVLGQLLRRLEEQKQADAKRSTELEQLGDARRRHGEAGAALAVAEAELRGLCAQARCADVADLDEAERRSREHLQADAEERAICAELLLSSEGLGLAELEAEMRAADRDEVIRELDELKARVEQQLAPERDRLRDELNEAERVFAAMNGGSDAADLALQVEQGRARIVALGQDYVRTVLARRVLRDEIERYRSAHRDPILQRAGAYFRELSCEAFVAIASQVDEDDQPVLTGLRRDGTPVRVAGMSTGTRDQLYLALRLATLEHLVRDAEPMPLVVDDILIQFDDRRADATLATLADFSRHTQVILFTHHLRDADCAARLAQRGGGVFVHRL